MSARPEQAAHQTGGVRSKAIAAALEILATAGPDQMSLKAIAARAEIGIASIYHYFASKDDLLLCLAILGFEDLRRQIERFQGLPDYAPPMRAGSVAFLTFAEQRPQQVSLMFSERLMARYDALREAEQGAFAAFCAAVEADQRMPTPHRANVALALWTLGRGIAGLTSSQPDRKIPPDTFARLLAGAAYLINHPE